MTEHLPASVLLHNVRSLYNVGAFFRTADAVGLSRLHLSGFTGAPPSKEIAKTALGSEQHVPWERSDPLVLIEEQRRLKWEIAAIETVDGATDLFEWQPQFPVLVIFGHEVEGLPPDDRESMRHARAHSDGGHQTVAQRRDRRRRRALRALQEESDGRQGVSVTLLP